jgi:hypothetical protein
MGIQLSDEVIASWGKYGQNKVINMMEQVSLRHDIDNPIGYITTVLKTSAVKGEVAAASESQTMLFHLISNFRKSKEPKQSWFVKDLSIEELQVTFGLDLHEASAKFEELKNELFKALEIKDLVVKELSEEETKEKKKRVEQFLKSR